MPLLPPQRWQPLRRLRQKTSLTQVVIIALDPDPEAAACNGRELYLVSLSHPKTTHSSCGQVLVAPETFTREQVLQKFLECCARPNYVDARSVQSGRGVALKFVSVFREYHAEDVNGVAHAHFHLAVQAGSKFMFMPVKRALLNNFGLSSHWSTSHDGYWSMIRYLWWPSPPKKPNGSLDKRAIKWAAPGYEHLPFEECCSEPMTAAALRAKRLKVDRQAATEETEAPRITDLDVWPIVVENKFKNTADDRSAKMQLMAWAKQRATEAMQRYLFKNRARLDALIEDIWEWEEVEKNLPFARASRMEALKAARESGCICGGAWVAAVKQSFDDNHINVEELCSAIMDAIAAGRGAATPVIVLVGARGGEGKSLFLKALYSVFGTQHVFKHPDKGNFPLLELPGKKIVFLDEWRFDSEVVSFQSQMQWFDGSQLSISRPQNIPGTTGHITYEGTAPIFATSKKADFKNLEQLARDDPRTGEPLCAEASMMLRRVRVFEYGTRIAAPAGRTPFCGCCFAKLILSRGKVQEHQLWAANEECTFL